MKTKLYKKNYYGWAGYCLENDVLSIGIVPSVGGRIISLKFQDEEFFYVDKNLMGKQNDLSDLTDLTSIKKKFGFQLWGGDKTWVAPENEWINLTPPLDLDSGEYEIELIEDGVIMTSPICRETGLQIIREIRLNQNDIFLTQHFINQSKQTKRCAIWNVTQMTRPCDLFFPAKNNYVDPVTRFSASVEHQSELVSFVEGWAKIACRAPIQFKYGALLSEPIAKAIREVNGKPLTMIRHVEIDPSATYPENHMFEVYNSSDYNYFEFEILSPLVDLKPNAKTTQRQRWEFI